MKYAVIRLKGRQYVVNEGDEFLADKQGKSGLEAEVLAIKDGDVMHLGTPVLTTAKVEIKDLGEEKGEKLHVYKFRAKSRYRRKMGFRPIFNRLKVGKISNKSS